MSNLFAFILSGKYHHTYDCCWLYWCRRVLGCDEDVATAVPSDGSASASYYEVTSSSNAAWPKSENRPDDAHDVRPVRWDGLVGDAINILRQSGQSQLRYQRHIFYPIRGSREGSEVLP